MWPYCEAFASLWRNEYWLPTLSVGLPLLGLLLFLGVQGSKSLKAPVAEDRLTGAIGRVTQGFNEAGEGKVMVAGEVWEAVYLPVSSTPVSSAKELLVEGTRVKVLGLQEELPHTLKVTL
jgi:membrane protein implicated in regulation of membrane protease activity